MEESLEIERKGLFAELVTFRGVRYGVTKFEMEIKMKGPLAPAVILEPNGVLQYEALCRQYGWDIFKAFVSTPEDVRIARLNERTAFDIRNDLEDHYNGESWNSFQKTADGYDKALAQIRRHTDRLQSITGEERGWMRMNDWDAILDGEDISTAIKQLEAGVAWRNRRSKPPRPITAVQLPLL